MNGRDGLGVSQGFVCKIHRMETKSVKLLFYYTFSKVLWI